MHRLFLSALLLAACTPEFLPLPINLQDAPPSESDAATPAPDAPVWSPTDAPGPRADSASDARPQEASVPDVTPAEDRPPVLADAGTDRPPSQEDQPGPTDHPPPACGTCAPPPAHAVADCAGGGCGWRCAPGWADCNGVTLDGCEVDTRARPDHCGACGNRCAEDGVCRDGACGCTAPAATVCGVACLDLTVRESRCVFCARYCFPTGGAPRLECCGAACRGC